MSLTSLQFFALLLLSIIIYYIIPKKFRWYSLLIFSVYFFCTSSELYTGIYLLTSIITTWICANKISESKSNNYDKGARRYLIVGILINLGILATLKYLNFVIENINMVLGIAHSSYRIKETQWLAPIGISFYTLQIIGYLLDVFWNITTAEESLLKTALFVAYYPQMTSGPITRHEEMKTRLFEQHDFRWENVTFGLQRVLWGIFKKLVISTRAGIIVDNIYSDTVRYDGFYIWVAAILFMLQLYTDFSGCMDIIIGASECYGIVLPENFKSPFFSGTVQEYWQRWHITLGAWLKDYILYPILSSSNWRKLSKWLKKHTNKNIAKQLPSYLGMLCVWLLIGLWHGGKWKYIIGMGLWFWIWIVLEQITDPWLKQVYTKFNINSDSFSWKLLRSFKVLVVVSIGNMFFKLESLKLTIATIHAGLRYWNPEILYDKSLYGLGLNEKNFQVMIIGSLMLLFVSAFNEKSSIREWIASQRIWFRWIIYFALIFIIIIFGQYGPGFDAQAFIYQGF